MESLGGKRSWRQAREEVIDTVTVKDAEGPSEDNGDGKGEEEKNLSDISEVELIGLGD